MAEHSQAASLMLRILTPLCYADISRRFAALHIVSRRTCSLGCSDLSPSCITAKRKLGDFEEYNLTDRFRQKKKKTKKKKERTEGKKDGFMDFQRFESNFLVSTSR